MTDEAKLRKDKSRGIQAKNLLENELLNKWWESAEKSLFAQYKAASISDHQRILELKALTDGLESMKKDFKRYVSDGEQAESRLGKKKTRLQKLTGN